MQAKHVAGRAAILGADLSPARTGIKALLGFRFIRLRRCLVYRWFAGRVQVFKLIHQNLALHKVADHSRFCPGCCEPVQNIVSTCFR